MSTTITPTEQNIDINVTNDVIDVNVTNNIVDVNATTQQINIDAAGSYPLPNSVFSVFGRVGDIVATEGDYTLTQLAGVTITNPVTDEILKYNGTNWVNGIFTSSGTVTNVSALTLGTSGTDLSSSVANSTSTPVITLNVPTASATNRGALSSADWTTFNNKQTALNGNGFVKISGNTISYDNSTYYLASNPNAYIALTALSGGAGINYNNTTGVIASTITQYTDALSRAALSFAAGSGAYNSTTGVITIPTNNNQITNGANYITLGSLSGGTGISYNNTTGVIASTITQYTDALARGSISLTTSGTSGAATYNNTTGVINIPQYTGDVTSVFGRTGAVVSANGDYTTSQVTEGTNLYYTEGRVSANSDVAANTAARHNAVTIATANGLSLSTQALSLALASGSTNGALSSTDWNTFNNKQAAGNYITSLTGEATASGPGAASVTLSTSAVTGKLLSGLNLTGGGTIADTDSILQAFGKVQNQISGMVGGVTYQGTWNASTNTPTLTSSVGTKGYYYIVSVDGSTNLNGITDWKVGDWAIFNGSTWDKVDNTDAVSSVNGFTGAVSLTTSNITEGTNLYYTEARVNANTNVAANTAARHNAVTIGTANGLSLSTQVLSLDLASGSTTGALSSTDWTTFNSKQAALNGTGFVKISGTTISYDNSTYLTTSSASSTYVPYTGANANVNLGTHTLIAAKGTFSSSGSGDTVGITHSSGSGIALNITKGGNGEGLYINKTSGSGNAATIIGTLNATTLVKSGGTSSQFLKADGSVDSTSYGTGSVTSVGLSSATSGVTIGSTPITTSGTITLAIATASGSAQGLLSSTDWTTFNNKQNALTNPVTGTGTTNYLPKFTGASTIGNSIVFDNGTNVGVNTASPSAKLDVVGGNGDGIQYRTSTRAIGIGQISSEPSIFWGSGTPLTFVSGSERMRLDASGNLGLGVTPSAWFTSAKAIQVLGAALEGRTTVTQLWCNGYVDAGASGNFYQYNGFASKYTQAFGEHQFFTAPSGTAGNAISFTQAMTLTASGVLLVGTTSSPSASTVKNVIMGSSSSDAYYQFTNGSGGGGIIGSNSGAGINFYTFTGAVGSETYTHRMLINSSGNVGIGSASPVTLLNISSGFPEFTLTRNDNGTTAAAAINFASTSTVRWQIATNKSIGNGFEINQGDGTTNRFYITSGGNVGIAVTGNAEQLSVKSTSSNNVAKFQVDVNGNGILFANASGTTVGSITIGSATTTYNVTSDYRLKQDFKDYSGLDLINKIKTYDYEWKSDKSRMYGVIAHELQSVINYAVTGVKDGKEMQGVDYSKIVPVLIKAIQEQQLQIDTLKNK
jgi:hypothetical protein